MTHHPVTHGPLWFTLLCFFADEITFSQKTAARLIQVTLVYGESGLQLAQESRTRGIESTDSLIQAPNNTEFDVNFILFRDMIINLIDY